MSRIKLDSEQRLAVGSLIKELREANEFTQPDVAIRLGIGGGSPMISRIEHGTASVSARRALDILTGLAATPEDHQLIESLVGAIPQLHSELFFDQLVAKHRDELGKHGAQTWLGRMTDLSLGQVRKRLGK